MNEIQVLLAVETNEVTKSDDIYYTYLLRTFFGGYLKRCGHNGLFIQYHFVYMNGCNNHHSVEVNRQIRIYTNDFQGRPTFVVYCFDVDRLGRKDKEKMQATIEQCTSDSSFVSLTCPEIETIFGLKNSSDREGCAREFAKHYPKKDGIHASRFFASLEEAANTRMRSNFCTVIQEIVQKYEERQPAEHK